MNMVSQEANMKTSQSPFCFDYHIDMEDNVYGSVNANSEASRFDGVVRDAAGNFILGYCGQLRGNGVGNTNHHHMLASQIAHIRKKDSTSSTDLQVLEPVPLEMVPILMADVRSTPVPRGCKVGFSLQKNRDYYGVKCHLSIVRHKTLLTASPTPAWRLVASPHPGPRRGLPPPPHPALLAVSPTPAPASRPPPTPAPRRLAASPPPARGTSRPPPPQPALPRGVPPPQLASRVGFAPVYNSLLGFMAMCTSKFGLRVGRKAELEGRISVEWKKTFKTGCTLHDHHQIPVIGEEQSICHYAPTTGSEEDVDCAVCLCKFVVGEEIRVLRCKHLFHRKCLDAWVGLRIAITCPLCREPVGPRRIINEVGAEVLLFQFCSNNNDDRDTWWLR
ncbi:hypothetical protein Fmac_003033 [Flemingia macrophylla]|uniref:RING-type domain-containing protein n=1 Tax=Flemingia macrophylla TaxID=520843 RepID=A0ABD1NLM1_9FABA